MQNRYRKIIAIASVLATVGAGVSWAGPPNPTASDAIGNTAGGTSALFDYSPGPTQQYCFRLPNPVSQQRRRQHRHRRRCAPKQRFRLFQHRHRQIRALLQHRGHCQHRHRHLHARLQHHGSANTASGSSTMRFNTTGSANTASGAAALVSNSTGTANTASGFRALSVNSRGNNNTASGAFTLKSNTIGRNNTASGDSALVSNTTGSDNTANGAYTLNYNSLGAANTASGISALYTNTTGNTNTAVGVNALLSNTTGSSNIALGYRAGSNLTTGSGNIAIGHEGVAGESSTIRIGASQTRTFLAGVRGKTVGGGSAVVINSSGQLGTVVSSARYKQDIQDMGQQSAKLQQLRPVTFHYTADPQGAKQYGLIAEEVAQVYPELVVYGEEGQIESVQYHQLISMLLNEVQHHQQQMEARTQQFTRQSQELAELKARNMRSRAAIVQVEALTARLAQVEAGQVTKVAQR